MRSYDVALGHIGSAQHESLEELSRLKLDAMTPLEALTKLYELQAIAKGPRI